APPVRSIY
nr:Chain E1, NUP53 R2 [Homo sapiens]7TBJ_E2 Chain E2, NUP53 R2 [Homo sapiens]7TBJ_E3 Chain E3, NUP53 R2 [Homo sapiens]7TBJ_E4 Chain E4, NUP53 R2 [Homo sapiens]7TBJ_E5 Chain E5, NUP53 R2 [Homo sapiens]7TBJ_E6 Chain E6, NUP53 R2 [Homo sapiens]7TBJ_E7 Chain E7, NUP53 R2 [Homo sapiens]7TBK_E1 Chain E1, NUP53 R2 [Homo sapiens]7TBK_E2 Chain E2, NUP53 R2 [Homo sapiens]7TBK_E3 Chain E3, NUP53 R2 [Homo sapiens]7TBK_E4 Chain E4, NUP53 R2 [Homo sapiens]7TBK_E5 Chain E5, NUP53 R2 [Homo sapiens]7TBK